MKIFRGWPVGRWRRDCIEAEGGERLTEPSSVCERRLDEHVEILGQPRLPVPRHGVAADEHEPHAMGDQRTQELGPNPSRATKKALVSHQHPRCGRFPGRFGSRDEDRRQRREDFAEAIPNHLRFANVELGCAEESVGQRNDRGRAHVSAGAVGRTQWTPPSPLAPTSFGLGWVLFSGEQLTAWYDDVALATTRIGCN